MYLKKRVTHFVFSLMITFFLLRFFLFFLPSANLILGKYNIHHLYTGAFLLVVVSIFFLVDIVNGYTTALAGIASAFILDELIYLIATDGSDQAYLSPMSIWGSIIVISIVLIVTGAVYFYAQRKK